MWLRNLFLLGVLLTGIVGVRAALFPPPVPTHVNNFDPAPLQSADFATLVNKVDASIEAGFARDAEILRPAPIADELTVARRLHLALMGTIPSLQEIRQLEAYEGQHRLQWWLEGILRDRRSADFLAERFARAYVGTEDGPFIVYRRRRFVSWLADEVAKNRPYDQVVRELIASSGLWTDKPATNFITVTVEQANKNQPNRERLAARVTRAFLGIRLDCAQCHNHPFEEWKQTDFQGLAAYFGQTHQGFTGIHDGDGELKLENRKTGAMETIPPHVPFRADLVPAEGTRRQQLAAWITHPQNPYFARVTVNRVWALMFGRPMLAKVDDVSSVEEVPEALRLLADDFVAHQYDLRRLIRVIAATKAFQRDSAADHEITDKHEVVWAAFPLTRLRPEQVVGSVQQASSLTTLDADTHILIRLATLGARNDFITRYGDIGEDEFENRGGTIPQRLLMMNGALVHDRTKEGIFTAATRIGWQASDDASAVRSAYLAVLTREPTPREATHFQKRLAGTSGNERSRRMEDIYWALINSTEFSWNHRSLDGTFAIGASLAGATWLTPLSEILARADDDNPRREPAQSVILLWLAGGPSQLETFDPHPGTTIAGDTGAVNTAARGIQLADTYPRLAEQMESLAVVRSVMSREGDHERGTYTVKTGHRPDPTVVHPSIGAICAHQLAVAGTQIPRHISIIPNQWPGRGGFLGDPFDAFRTGDPLQRVPDVASRVTSERDAQRNRDLAVVERAFAERRQTRVASTQHPSTMARARTMMTSEQLQAFDVSRESAQLRSAYGDTPFGRGCLAARRLIEVGVRCVEVTLSGWDTHADNHEGCRTQAAILDPAFAALIRDLKERQLLRRTIVLCAGEFGRTPTINRLGGRDHWPNGFSVVLAGGGLRGGVAIGATDPDGRRDPTDPVNIADIHATVLSALGIDFARLMHTPIGRTVRFSEGTPIRRLIG